jgi:amino acid permease
MMKTQIGLGVLSLPSVLNTLGLIPGVIILCVIAGITTWSDYMVGVFKRNHPDVYGVDDVGQLLFGRIGKELFAAAFMGRMPPTCMGFWELLLMNAAEYVMTAGSAMLSLSIGFNALSNHGACTAVFVAVAFVLVLACASLRTLGNITWVAITGVFSIITGGKSLA